MPKVLTSGKDQFEDGAQYVPLPEYVSMANEYTECKSMLIKKMDEMQECLAMVAKYREAVEALQKKSSAGQAMKCLLSRSKMSH